MKLLLLLEWLNQQIDRGAGYRGQSEFRDCDGVIGQLLNAEQSMARHDIDG